MWHEGRGGVTSLSQVWHAPLVMVLGDYGARPQEKNSTLLCSLSPIGVIGCTLADASTPLWLCAHSYRIYILSCTYVSEGAAAGSTRPGVLVLIAALSTPTVSEPPHCSSLTPILLLLVGPFLIRSLCDPPTLLLWLPSHQRHEGPRPFESQGATDRGPQSSSSICVEAAASYPNSLLSPNTNTSGEC